MKSSVRVILASLTIIVFAAGVLIIFWKQELKYSLPTPVPYNYQSVAIGEKITLPASLQKDQAYFIHFYSAECPCSRFNARHIQSLIRSYQDSIAFIIVVRTSQDKTKALKLFGSDLQVLIDNHEDIAKACGVYSTPQAAIIDKNGNLFYRGNYNRSRYCTTRASNFAELSLVALLNDQPLPTFGILATQSYGCELSPAETAELEFF
ncbi:MAG TPA: redoxin domain-containing protein [Ohtaekwangia sp.]